MRGGDRSNLSPHHLCGHRVHRRDRRFGGLGMWRRVGVEAAAECLNERGRWREVVTWDAGFVPAHGLRGRICFLASLKPAVVEAHRTEIHNQEGNRYAALRW